ncbi:hypothetical protein Agub_g8997, partial [Astrephomene gubernaculifera]
MHAYKTGGALGVRLARSRPFHVNVANRASPANAVRHSPTQALATLALARTCMRPAALDHARSTMAMAARAQSLRLPLRSGLSPALPGRGLAWRQNLRLSTLASPLAAVPQDAASGASASPPATPQPAAVSNQQPPPSPSTPTSTTHRPLPLSSSLGGTPVHPGGGYKLPPPEIAAIVEAPAQPSLSYSPDRTMFLQLSRPPSLPPISELSRPELKLAGLRLDPDQYSRSKMGYYTGMSLVPASEVVPAPPDKCRPLSGYPPHGWINYVTWSPRGSHIAFTVRYPHAPYRPLELYLADPATGECRPALPAPCTSPPTHLMNLCPGFRGLNTVFEDYTWLDDDTLVAAVLPEGLQPPPGRPAEGPMGPKISDNTAGKKAQNRTWPDLLKDEHDMALFEHYGTCELLLLEVGSGRSSCIGPPRMYIDVDPSPDGRFLLVTWLERPFSTAVPCGRFPRRTQLWRRDGSLVRELAALPLAEHIPIAFNSCRAGPRGISWRDDVPAELYWMEAQDGGDPELQVPPRDLVFALTADAAAAGEAPRRIGATDLRCGGVAWCDGELAILFESWYKSRRSVWWGFAPDRPEEPKRVIFDRNYEDVYGDPGSPLSRRTQWGTYTLARVTPDPTTLAALRQAAEAAGAEGAAEAAAASVPAADTSSSSSDSSAAQPASSSSSSGSSGKPVTLSGLASGEGTWLLMSGSGAGPEGNKPFLDLLHLESGETHRLWQSAPPHYEAMGSLMSDTDPEAPLTVEGMVLSMSRESASDPPQTLLRTFRAAGRDCEERLVTAFPHPYPHLRELRREVLRYPRASDGVMLTATLYLPPGYDQATHGSLPCIVWAYPREFKTKEAAGQMRRSPHQFTSIGSTSPTLWLTRGFAVLDGPTLPIVADEKEGEGEGGKAPEPNDTFVEQLTDSARAAVNEVVRRGVADPARISVGGHSYGAFMTANLIAHAPDLFAAGIARTGAYNRTLTPFGFQNEERTLWQAPEVYSRMSPFMMADKISKPLLLIHGEDDNNPGTFPLQSERFYQALKGHGATCRLVLLPHEGHGYRAYESVMHTLYEQDQWIERYAGYGRLDPNYVTDDT